MLQVTPQHGARLDKAIAAAVPESVTLSRSRLTALIRQGAVRDGAGEVLSDPSAAVRGAMEVHLRLPPPVEAAAKPEAMALDVVFEDDDLLVINKPRGVVVHPGAGVSSGTLVNGLLAHCAGSLSGIGGEARPGIVHRIDKDTSGLLVVAKNDRAHQGLTVQFAAHSVHRRYRALVWGLPDAGDPRMRAVEGVSLEAGGVVRIDAPLGRHPRDRLKMAVRKGGRRAVTRGRVLARLGPSCEMEMWLETGRTHQIRVHMSHIGHPLVGDMVYGQRRTLPKQTPDAARAVIDDFAGQALHAAELGFEHPVGGEMLTFTADPPDVYLQLRAALAEMDQN